MNRLLTCIVIAIATLNIAREELRAQTPVSEPYQWKNVRIVGGGFLDGIIFHPKESGLRYCRTDVGGAYRWDTLKKEWIPLNDWIGLEDYNLYGIESLALDPNDPDKVYLSCGTYMNYEDGAILKSGDRGNTWKRIDMPFRIGGNENGRGNGERMMVDPANGNIIYLGTRLNGLWRSVDQGETWAQVSSFPELYGPAPVLEKAARPGANNRLGNGIVTVVFDPSSAVAGKGCSTIYVGTSLIGKENFFVSKDSGKTWKAVPGQPVQYGITHCILASDGNFFITYGTNPGPVNMKDGAVWKYTTQSGTWKNISPYRPDSTKGEYFGYAAVAVDQNNPKHVIVSSFNRKISKALEDDVFRSIDGGETWTALFGGGGKFDYTLAPYVQFTPLHWMFDLEIDPFNANHAMMTTGYGGWETYDLSSADTQSPTHWQIMAPGVEEMVPLDMLSPKEGADLITAVGDYGGFTHFDLDKVQPSSFSNPFFANGTGVACAENRPNLIVRVGIPSAHHNGGSIGYSRDGGRNWYEPETVPDKRYRAGSIAVSENGDTWIWSPSGGIPGGGAPAAGPAGSASPTRMAGTPVYYTKDEGKSWHECQGIPGNTKVIADRINHQKFYALNLREGKIYESTDGGKSFQAKELKLPQSANTGSTGFGQGKLYVTPEREGNLWISTADGLYNAADGENFVRLPLVEAVQGFGFGRKAPGSDYPALYLVGVVQGVRGFYRSDNEAKNWIRINDNEHEFGQVMQVTGDPKKYGRVYIGTFGRGALYGDPVQ